MDLRSSNTLSAQVHSFAQLISSFASSNMFQRNCILFVVFRLQYIISYIFPGKSSKELYSGYSIQHSSISYYKYFFQEEVQRNCILLTVFRIQFIISYIFSRKKFKGIVFCLQYSVSSKSFHKYFSRKKWKGITSIPTFAAAINQSFANQQLQGTAILTIDDENPYGWSHYHKQVVIIIFFYWTQVRSLPFQ